jgi:hypothetical protein
MLSGDFLTMGPERRQVARFPDRPLSCNGAPQLISSRFSTRNWKKAQSLICGANSSLHSILGLKHGRNLPFSGAITLDLRFRLAIFPIPQLSVPPKFGVYTVNLSILEVARIVHSRVVHNERGHK